MKRLTCAHSCLLNAAGTCDEKQEKQEREDETAPLSLSPDTSKMDAVFFAAFTLIKTVHPSFVMACQTSLKNWDLEDYDHFKGQFYACLSDAVKDNDHSVVQTVLSFCLDVDM